MKDLNSVLAGNVEEINYFNSLPDYVQNVINSQANTIHSADDLHWYANALLNLE